MKVALVVDDSNSHARSMVRLLQEAENYVQLVAVVDMSDELSSLCDNGKTDYCLTNDLSELATISSFTAVINTAQDQEVYYWLKENLPPQVEIINTASNLFKIIDILWKDCPGKEELIEARRLKGELWGILNSVQDAIEVSDEHGMIKYVNPAFTRVTGIPYLERVGQNIFDVSPHGALANSLIRQKPVTGYRTVVGGSEVEVISNASPIFVDNVVKGAVVVFQKVTDILKLMEELEKSHNLVENLYFQLNSTSGLRWTFDTLIGKSKSFKSTVDLARKISRSDAPVLIQGETATGKGVFAQAIHHNSYRQKAPFISLDTSLIPESLLEVELLGCEKGAYPGAFRTSMGQAELAHNGTLFIKGIDRLNYHLQDRLLRLIREGKFQRFGGKEELAADVRVIASTHQDLKKMVMQGKFREELHTELSVYYLEISPLRQRPEDVCALAEAFLQQLNRKFNRDVTSISDQALQALTDYDWQGNIRELWNVMERAVMSVEETTILPEHLSPYLSWPVSGTSLFPDVVPLERMEQIMIKSALARYGDSLKGKKKAARALNISLATLYNKLKKS